MAFCLSDYKILYKFSDFFSISNYNWGFDLYPFQMFNLKIIKFGIAKNLKKFNISVNSFNLLITAAKPFSRKINEEYHCTSQF